MKDYQPMPTKIAVIVRTRDEEPRIAQFCESYKDADMILVADGGSVDRTKEIASRYPNVIIRDFTERTYLENGYWRNNDSAHANFLFAWAREMKADWMIYHDCDCRPNYLLRENYRSILQDTKADVVMATFFYLWGTDMYFPWMCKLEETHTKFENALWAWRGHLDLWTVNIPPAYYFRIGDKKVTEFRTDFNTAEIWPPYANMHFAWDTPERALEKVRTYRKSGLIPGMLHPLEFGGPLETLPEYLHE
jgi:glycosyltransferase involved in cell wall biosynthesis